MSEFTGPLGHLSEETVDYVNLKIDEIKLKTVKGLSLTLGKLIWILLIFAVASMILMSLAFGIVFLLGQLMNNYFLGALIVAAFFILLLVLMVAFKGKLFRNTFVPMFVSIFFDRRQDEKRLQSD